jgi:hypothetical protein
VVMSRLIDGFSVLLVAAAGTCFTLSLLALGEERDLHALYWLAIGGISLKAAVDLLRPGRS